jgi:hypothetical protein
MTYTAQILIERKWAAFLQSHERPKNGLLGDRPDDKVLIDFGAWELSKNQSE